MDRGAWGRKESDMTEQLHALFFMLLVPRDISKEGPVLWFFFFFWPENKTKQTHKQKQSWDMGCTLNSFMFKRVRYPVKASDLT